MSAHDTEEEDQDSDYSDLVQDSEDEDDECNKEEEEEGKDQESEDENGSASDFDASLLGGNLLFAGLILYSLIPIYFAEAIDSDEIQSYRFDRDGFDGSGPTVRARQLPVLVFGNLNSKFWMFYTNQGAEWENKLPRDRMERHCLNVTCLTQAEYDITMAHTSRFGITVITLYSHYI